jgi:hypothetical protein
MNADAKKLYEATIALLKPALERVASDAEFRARLEQAPLAVLDELGIELDAATRAELTGKRFSEFWAARRRTVEGPVEIRDLPPEKGALEDQQLEAVAGGAGLPVLGVGLPGAPLASGPLVNFAPPYVPVMPSLNRKL